MTITIAAGVWLWYGPFWSQCMALFLWAVAVGVGLRLLSRLPETLRSRFLAIAAPTVLFAMTTALYHPFALGRMPWMADHLVHQARARIFWDHFFTQGRLSGWTHLQEAGVPFETLYPPGADITLSAVHALTLGQLSWETTYALTFFAFLMLYVGTFYFLGKRFGGPLAGFLAGFFALTDAGAFRQGGFSFIVQWGVWPLSFSLILALWALYMAHRWYETGHGFWRSTLLGAYALCVHPFSLFVVFPLHFLLAFFHPSLKHFLHRKFGGPLILSVTTFLFASWWLIPFLIYGPTFSAPVPSLAGNLHQVASGIVDAAPWANADAWTAVLGIAGIIWTLYACHFPFLQALSYYALFVLVLGSTSVLAGLNVFSWMPSLSHVQFPRFLLVVKAAAFLSGAMFFVSLRLAKPPESVLSSPLPRFLWLPALLLVFPVGQKIIEHYFLPLTDYTTNPSWKPHVQQAARRLSKMAVQRPGFFRVALDGPFNDHRLMSIVTQTGLPFVKLSYMPAETFIHAAHENPADVPRSRDELIRFNVAYVVSVGPSSLPDLRLLDQFGDIYLYEFASASPVRFELNPHARVSIVRFDDEHIQFQIADLPPEGGTLRVYVAPFARWKTFVNGQEIPLQEYRPTPRQTFLQMPVHNGSVELVYVRRSPDMAGLWLTSGVFFLFLFIRVVPTSWKEFLLYKNSVGVKFLKIYDHIHRFIIKLKLKWIEYYNTTLKKVVFSRKIIVVLLIIIGFGFVVWLREQTPDGAFSLHRAYVRVDEGLATRACHYVFPQRFLCGSAHRYVGLELREVGKKVRRGIWAHPLEGARLQIEFPNVWVAGSLQIQAGIADSGSGSTPVFLRTYFDDRLVDTWSRSMPGVWETRVIPTTEYVGRRITIRFEITTSFVGGRHLLFYPSF